ncbi:MAG: hypothetical protein ACMUIP_09905 [bacterium]
MKNIDDVTSLISDIDDEQKAVPILLRHYLELGAKLLSFSIDNKFSSPFYNFIRTICSGSRLYVLLFTAHE